MKFTISKHAEDVIREREIPHAWISLVLNAPDRIEKDREDPTHDSCARSYP
jgi:hypothetical protein